MKSDADRTDVERIASGQGGRARNLRGRYRVDIYPCRKSERRHTMNDASQSIRASIFNQLPPLLVKMPKPAAKPELPPLGGPDPNPIRQPPSNCSA
jgi:hypothetical protein